jgi:hypothetical protein
MAGRAKRLLSSVNSRLGTRLIAAHQPLVKGRPLFPTLQLAWAVSNEIVTLFLPGRLNKAAVASLHLLQMIAP